MAGIALRNVSKAFGRVEVIRDLDLEIEDGELVVFVGPSGCGKSTLLRLIAGLEEVSAGEVLIGGRNVTHLPPARRALSMVFQSYALYPHMSVRENIAFPLRMAREDKAAASQRVLEAARILNLEDHLDRKPRELSGGQRQRVAIGRAIVRQPAAFLFDEPLSNLDAALRVSMRLEIATLHRRLGTTMIYVTHDQIEAMTLADRIVVFNAGSVEQVGSPLEAYHRPATVFVAGFIGSPRMNLLSGAEARRHGAATVGIRPEHLSFSAIEGRWCGAVELTEHLGSDSIVHVEVDGIGTLAVRAPGDIDVRPGESLWLTPDETRLHRFDERGRAIR
ncbi:MAG: ABC transporter ATP-binding protein [Steroidobacteraceae bacterium]